jgi:hypothetical protein
MEAGTDSLLYWPLVAFIAASSAAASGIAALIWIAITVFDISAIARRSRRD